MLLPIGNHCNQHFCAHEFYNQSTKSMVGDYFQIEVTSENDISALIMPLIAQIICFSDNIYCLKTLLIGFRPAFHI